MTIGVKIIPELYKYLQFSGKSCISQLKPVKFSHVNNFTLSKDTFQILRHSPQEISQAYREYAKSPYINAYLREHIPLSEKSNKLVSCLKQAINDSEPVSGKFYRGLTGCKDEETVRNFILKNDGFTSVAPEINKCYAESFAVGRSGAFVEFNLKTPVRGFKDNNYEVVFDTNVFTPDKYDLVKVSNNYFKVVEKSNTSTRSGRAMLQSHFDKGDTLQFGTIPDNYFKKTREFVGSCTYIPKFGKNKGVVQMIPSHWEETNKLLPYYRIDKLWTTGPGSGTLSVQGVVAKSLADKRTQGRVMLDACCIDGKTSPAGFYYKLGFRFSCSDYNKELETWLMNGGNKTNAPFLTGIMYLPKESIEHCLNYGRGLVGKS